MLDIDTIIESEGLLQTKFDEGYSFTYRLLTLKEYRIFSGLRGSGIMPLPLLADKVFERCYLGDKYLLPENLPAGITVTLGNLILYLSGDCDEQTLKDDLTIIRNSYPVDSIYEYMKRMICLAFPYKWEELEQLTRRELMSLFVVSETILVQKYPDYKPMDIKAIKYNDEQNTTSHNIDFAAENRAIRSTLGAFNEEEAKPTNLSKEQLAKLRNRSPRR